MSNSTDTKTFDVKANSLEHSSTEKSLITDEHGNTAVVGVADSLVIDKVAERRLVRKFDIRILPLLAVMYLMNSLDKSNLGNAKTGGTFESDLGMAGTNGYNIVISIFFVPYVLTAPFLGILGKKYGPSRVLPIMMACFGLMTTCMAATTNFSGVFALRWFLGMAESAFFPLVIYYQTQFYKRGELARRLALFYAASNIAGAFGGLLAFGVFQIKNAALQNWRYLFIIEGACTIAMSVLAFLYLPYSAAEARFLNDEEKKLAFYRMQVDSSSVVNEKFVLREALKIFKEPTSWMILAIEMCLGVPLQSVQLFLPQIVARLGYSTVKTNLYTVAPNIVGAVVLLILAFASDLTRWRFPFVALGFSLTFLGFIIYAAIDVQHSLQVAYFATFLMTMGTSAPSVILDVWANNNIASENRRVVLTSVAVPVANMMGILSSNIFFPSSAPAYVPALATTAAFGATGILLTLLLGGWMIVDNGRRNRAQGTKKRGQDVPTELLAEGPRSEHFRWCY